MWFVGCERERAKPKSENKTTMNERKRQSNDHPTGETTKKSDAVDAPEDLENRNGLTENISKENLEALEAILAELPQLDIDQSPKSWMVETLYDMQFAIKAEINPPTIPPDAKPGIEEARLAKIIRVRIWTICATLVGGLPYLAPSSGITTGEAMTQVEFAKEDMVTLERDIGALNDYLNAQDSNSPATE